MFKQGLKFLAVFFIIMLTVGCYNKVRIENAAGRPTDYEDPGTSGKISGISVESQDIVSATDKMMRDIMAGKWLANWIAARSTPPRIVVDSKYFRNESSSIIDKKLFTDRLRTELISNADGRIVILGRHYVDMIEKERILEEEDVVTEGSEGPAKTSLGWDFRLGGRIASLDTTKSTSGFKSRYHQITFELIKRGTGEIVWSKTYEFRKTGQDYLPERY